MAGLPPEEAQYGSLGSPQAAPPPPLRRRQRAHQQLAAVSLVPAQHRVQAVNLGAGAEVQTVQLGAHRPLANYLGDDEASLGGGLAGEDRNVRHNLEGLHFMLDQTWEYVLSSIFDTIYLNE